MRLAVLGAVESWYVEDLRRAAAGNHEVLAIPFRRLSSTVGGETIGVRVPEANLQEADCVLVRTMPASSLDQVVFRMDALAQLEASGVPVINPPKAIETAVDKYVSLARLQRAGLAVPRTHVCQSPDQAMEAFEKLGGNVVLKPIFGAEGRGMTHLEDEGLAWRHFSILAQLGAVLYVQEFIAHPGHDLRALVIGEQVLGMKRSNPNDWRTNLSRGARATACELDAEQIAMARAAAEAVGAPLAGVDLLPADDGSTYVLEVNAVPGWRGMAKAQQTDVAALILDFLVARARQDR